MQNKEACTRKPGGKKQTSRKIVRRRRLPHRKPTRKVERKQRRGMTQIQKSDLFFSVSYNVRHYFSLYFFTQISGERKEERNVLSKYDNAMFFFLSWNVGHPLFFSPLRVISEGPPWPEVLASRSSFATKIRRVGNFVGPRRANFAHVSFVCLFWLFAIPVLSGENLPAPFFVW